MFCDGIKPRLQRATKADTRVTERGIRAILPVLTALTVMRSVPRQMLRRTILLIDFPSNLRLWAIKENMNIWLSF